MISDCAVFRKYGNFMIYGEGISISGIYFQGGGSNSVGHREVFLNGYIVNYI